MVPQDAVKRRKVEKKDAATASMFEFLAMDFFIKMDVLAEASPAHSAISARALGCLRGARFASCRAQAKILRHSRKTSHVADVDPSPNSALH